MTTRILLSLALLGTAACKTKEDATNVPEDTAVSSDATSSDEPSSVGAPQEPPPPAIAQAAHAYMIGNYDGAIASLTPLWNDLREREQHHASGLAAGWLALAHAQLVFENAEEPYKYALSMAEQTQDPELTTLAKVAHGAFLLGQEDFESARQAFLVASEGHSQSLAGALASILRAESLIGSAFGSGDSETVQNPADLEAAKVAYEAAADVAESGIETDIVMGRVEEGRAAIAKFQRDKTAACEHAAAAIKHLTAAEASDFLVEGPSRVMQEFRCQ